MRKIFSSQRVETVEGVATLLREAGIEVRISNGRSYHSRRSGQFSYLEVGNAQTHPTLWVVHANDQPRAREILREARLLDTTRRDLPGVEYTFAVQPGDARRPSNWAWRIRIGLLLVIGVAALFVVLRHRAAPQNAPAAQPAPQAQPARQPVQPATPPPVEDEDRVRIQPVQ